MSYINYFHFIILSLAPCQDMVCGEICFVLGDMAGFCDEKGKCSYDQDNLGRDNVNSTPKGKCKSSKMS